MKSLPKRQTILNVLDQLISGTIGRQEVSEWAVAIIDDDEIVIADRVVWDLLKKLGSANLIAVDRPFLYDEIDFSSWRKSFVGQGNLGSS